MVYPALLPLIRTPRLPVVDYNWRPRRFNWTRPFPRKTKSGFCACAITFQTQSTRLNFSCGTISAEAFLSREFQWIILLQWPRIISRVSDYNLCSIDCLSFQFLCFLYYTHNTHVREVASQLGAKWSLVCLSTFRRPGLCKQHFSSFSPPQANCKHIQGPHFPIREVALLQ